MERDKNHIQLSRDWFIIICVRHSWSGSVNICVIWGSNKVSTNRIKEIEEKIADLKARWPAHSVPPSMWQQLEELEEQLEEARGVGSSDAD